MLSLDPELASFIQQLKQQTGDIPRLPKGDWENRRLQLDQMFHLIANQFQVPEPVQVEHFDLEVSGNESIPLRFYKADASRSDAVLLYVHGGGRFALNLDHYDATCRYYAAKTGLGVLGVDFRNAPEYPYPTPMEDCYAALVWLDSNADVLGVDKNKIAVIGDSGGGGLAAGIALMARDLNGPQLSHQFLIYPMLDDRNVVPDPQIEPFAFWTYDDNYTGWQCFLGELFGSDDVPAWAAPARETNYSDLPPAFIEVGMLDIFRDESLHYAQQLLKAGSSVEFHLYPGLPHGIEAMAMHTAIAQQVLDTRFKAISRFAN